MPEKTWRTGPETIIVTISLERRGRQGRALEVLLLALAFALVNVASAYFQEPISMQNGKGWDGATYCQVAEQLSRGERPSGRAPFVYRIGAPYLVSMVLPSGLGVVQAFKVVNLVANALALLLLIVWLRLYLADWRIRTLLALLFITQWHAPIRFVHFYPTLVESWFGVVVLGLLIGIHKLRAAPSWIGVGVFCAMAFIGALVREVALLLPLALLFASDPIARDNRSAFGVRIERLPRLAFFLPVVFGIAALMFVRSLASQTFEYGFLSTALNLAYGKPLLTYVHAWFIAFGPVLVIAVYNWRSGLSLLASHQFLFAFIICVAASAWLGGSDTERFLYWAMPVVFVLIGRAIEENAVVLRSGGLIALFGVSQAVSQRLFWTTPDIPKPVAHVFPVLTPMTGEVAYRDLLSFHGERWVEAISLMEYLVVAALLLLWIRHRARAARESGPGDE